MITELPSYRTPVYEAIRCSCRRLYLVYTGQSDREAREAEFRADVFGARFVDAGVEPFLNCACGQALNFAPEASLMIQ